MKLLTKKPRQTIIGNIFETYDYDMFHFLEENRQINPSNVEKIKKSMQVKRLLNPILVGPNGGIYDGQHNYTALKELGWPIQYVVDDTVTIEDIPRLNSIAKTWSQKEYLAYYCKRGFKEYKKINDFVLDHNLSINLAITFLAFEENRKSNNNFKYGLFKSRNIAKSKKMAEKFNILKGFNPKLGRNFARVLVSLGKNKDFDIDIFIKKVKIQPTKLEVCATSDQYKTLIEQIYNYKNRNKVNLRF